MEAKSKDAEQENGHLKKELEELRVGFAAQKKELEDEYQNYPSDDENATPNSSAQGNGVLSAAEPFDG
ncbi:hypothetical protein VitviT2T_022788 [Vitis vinifera]|uniref:Uncharacterized protein n=2 Tax=Vitis vinifera TaxID=29760 RepID=A0A438CXY9_VITVI|nr:hypothetical protein CK203_097973 [Vitis vinifera]RVW75647.1 hypothetical protein CK203_055245 [Vitis vinifera]WKA04781.1 hypothetical protein VitviT2T_022788 [Vitis vinifera]